MNSKNRLVTPRPTTTELNILRILWGLGPCTVRQVHEALNREEPSGYTTALKMLQVMHKKGLVKRNDSQRAHVYAAAVSKNQTQKQFLSELLDKLFDGSTSQLVMQALGTGPETDQGELERIKELLEDLEGH